MTKKRLPPPISIKVVTGREATDCAIAAVATYFSLRYEDVLKEAVLIEPHGRGTAGLLTDEITALAKKLGRLLVYTPRFDIEEATGIIVFSDHVANLIGGVIVDANGTVWKWEDFAVVHPRYANPEGLLYQPEPRKRKRKET